MFWNKKKVDFNLFKEGIEITIRKQKWIITEICNYDWNVDGKSIEYLIKNKDGEERFLEVERHEGAYELYFSEAILLDDQDMKTAIQDGFITFNGEVYDLEESYTGAFKNETTMSSWTPVESYLFYNNEEVMITIEITEQKSYSAFYGIEMKESDIQL
ncbi:DUF4178 domain-containing protein [Nonlabens sp.]|uniref:DUF4178 domain-containing protein n=1 Tax=Nonlabens sp. TaxID=1888209 RepID=UPI003F69897B